MDYFFSESINEPPAETVAAYCSRCNGEIYDYEEYAIDGDRVLCCECLDAELNELPLWAKAQLLGMEVKSNERNCVR